LAIIIALIISYISKRFKAVENPDVDRVIEALPGRNCTACGYPNCDALAEAIVQRKAKPNACALGGNETAAKVSVILGITTEKQDPKVAKVFCNGGIQNDDNRSDYHGIDTCEAARLISQGLKQCLYGCLMFYDCAKACPIDAIKIDEINLPKVIKEKCVGCGLCVKACPLVLIELLPKKAMVHVICSSQDTTKDTIKNCKVGCIACKKCEQTCKFDAIHVRDNHAHVDYAKCTNCGDCVQVCPRKIIQKENE